MIIFDLVVIIITVADVITMIAAGQNQTGAAQSVESVGWLRVVRILRIARILRIFRVFRELWILWSAIANSLDTLVWVLMVLFMLVYMCACACLELLNGRVQTGLLDPHEEVMVVVGVFLIAARLNVLNFLVGMLCHSAESVVEAENEAKFRKEVAAVRHALNKETAEMSLRGGGEHYLNEEVIKQMWDRASLQGAAARVQLTSRDAVGVLRKLDPANEGRVQTDSFVEGW